MLIDEVLELYHEKWALVTAGNADNFNTMTIGWGGLGTLWSTKVATVYVKPCRYTYNYLNDNEYFTVSFFDEEYRKDLEYLGRHSGKDEDKVAKTSLHPVKVGASMGFKEAKVTLLCKKIYYQDLELDKMPQEVIEHYYLEEAPHRMYVGEVIEQINN